MIIVASDARRSPRAPLVAGLLLLASCVADATSGTSASSLKLRPVQVEGSTAKVAQRSLELLGPDEPGAATMWEGPIRASGSAVDAPCTMEAELITGLFADAGGRALLVVSRSGSATYLELFRLATCERAAASAALFSEGIAVRGERIEVLPGCECAAPPDVCTCSAGRVLHVTADLKLSEDVGASQALTREHLGVGFVGEARVAAPGSPRARIVED